MPKNLLNLFSGHWRDIMSLVDNFVMFTVCSMNKGDIKCFWIDLWNCGVLQWRFPQMNIFLKSRNISVVRFLSNSSTRKFWLPLSTHDAMKLTELQNLVMDIQRVETDDDQWSYIWENYNSSLAIGPTGSCGIQFQLHLFLNVFRKPKFKTRPTFSEFL